MKVTCIRCGKEVSRKPSSVGAGNRFCTKTCYYAWQSERSRFSGYEDARRTQYHEFKRKLWGGSGHGHNQIAGKWAGKFGRRFERIAEQRIFPREGFTEIVNLTACSNQFFVDFVVTRKMQRVLVDVTTKFKAYVPSKVRLARALRMPLYILHVSPKDPAVYFLSKMTKNKTVSRVPMAFFYGLESL